MSIIILSSSHKIRQFQIKRTRRKLNTFQKVKKKSESTSALDIPSNLAQRKIHRFQVKVTDSNPES